MRGSSFIDGRRVHPPPVGGNFNRGKNFTDRNPD